MVHKKRKKEKKREFTPKADFQAVLNLPIRLVEIMQLLLHIEPATWNLMTARLQQKKPAPYKLYKKSKGKGKGFRHFAVPCDELMVVQTKILNHFLSSIPVHFSRHGNVKGSSILTNAMHHAGFAVAGFEVDLVNAFPTVFRSRMMANLRKPFQFALRQFEGITLEDSDVELMLEALVDLICFRDRLPQGPPSSPRVLDLVCMNMDKQIFALLQKHTTPFRKFKQTAWADNLYISSNEEIPEEVRNEMIKIVIDNGFIAHTRKDKTVYSSPETGRTPIVTGLVVRPEARLTMAPRKVNQMRGRLMNQLRYNAWDDQRRQEVQGVVAFIRQVYPEKLPSRLAKVVPQAEQRLLAEKFVESAEHLKQVDAKAPAQLLKGTAKAKTFGK